MYKNATRIKLRFETSRGYLTIEDLWDLSLQNLNTLAKGLKRKLNQSAEEDFLDDVSEEDTITKLQFDIVLDVLNTKKAELKANKEAAENKLHNQKILGIIAAKQDEALTNMSIEDLQKQLK